MTKNDDPSAKPNSHLFLPDEVANPRWVQREKLGKQLLEWRKLRRVSLIGGLVYGLIAAFALRSTIDSQTPLNIYFQVFAIVFAVASALCLLSAIWRPRDEKSGNAAALLTTALVVLIVLVGTLILAPSHGLERLLTAGHLFAFGIGAAVVYFISVRVKK